MSLQEASKCKHGKTMKNKIFLTLVLIFSLTQSFGQDCGEMADNEVQRLDKEDGPLWQSRIQDQDGVGTCFANTTSVALQTLLPGKPDISYLHLAFASAQVEQAPINDKRGVDSAYRVSEEGQKAGLLIDGGDVCETIKSAQSPKIGGVCLRNDVLLEKMIFNSQTNNSQDNLFLQKKLIEAVSTYYDSTKLAFGTNDKAQALNDYTKAFNDIIKKNQEAFTVKNCSAADTSNAEAVLKNSLARIYVYLVNKYGAISTDQMHKPINGKMNPDARLYFYFRSISDNEFRDARSEMKTNISPNIKAMLEKKYISSLQSVTPPKNALSVLRSALINIDGENTAENTFFVDKMISEFSNEDKELLNDDYVRYVKKDIQSCMIKNALNYYKSDEGLIKDFSSDPCLGSYLTQGRNIKNLAMILDQHSLTNIDALNNFMNKLPNLNYEQAMKAIIAPDCSDDKKIKLPESIKCENTIFSYAAFLTQKMIDDGKTTFDDVDKKILEEMGNVEKFAEDDYNQKINSLENKYAGRTDSLALLSKKNELVQLSNEKINRMNAKFPNATIKVVKELAKDEEPQIWNNFLSNNKKKFNSDAITLIKNSKQAVPITICTSMFSNPDATALRDGGCMKNPKNDQYSDVGGYHSVALVGVRCQKGKLNYLVQNSWGDWSGIKKAKKADGSQYYESELGKAWMDEDEIMNNSFGYQKISK